MADTFPSMYIPQWRAVPGQGLEAYDTYSEKGLRPPPAPSPSELTQEQRMQNPEEYIRRLIAETSREVPDAPEGNMWAPGVRAKMPERNLDDARQRRFLGQMIETYGAPTGQGPLMAGPYTSFASPEARAAKFVRPESWSNLPPEVADQMERYYAENYGKSAAGRENDGRYESTGLLGPGSPGRAAMDWIISAPQMFYGVSEAGANRAGGVETTPEQVSEKLDTAAGTFFGPVLEPLHAAGVLPENSSIWSKRQKAREAMDADMAVDPNRNTRWVDSRGPRAMQDLAENSIQGDSGEDLLNRYGVDNMIGRLGTAIYGAGMDAMLNPIPPDLAAISAASRARKIGSVLGQTAMEFGLDAGSVGFQYGTGAYD